MYILTSVKWMKSLTKYGVSHLKSQNSEDTEDHFQFKAIMIYVQVPDYQGLQSKTRSQNTNNNKK